MSRHNISRINKNYDFFPVDPIYKVMYGPR